MKSPKWTRDELILALELYFRCPQCISKKNSPEIVELSNILNTLPIHPQKSEFEKFRNPAGVYMKLCNFLRFDPNYFGVGLKAGGKLEEDIWNEFIADKDRLKIIAGAITENSQDVPRPSFGEIELDEIEFEEGFVLTRLHKLRERSPSLSRKKKEVVFARTGKLECEVCDFDFYEFYGELGQGVAECHHIVPVSKLKKGTKTKLSDLSILCANCHRIIHYSKPMLSIPQLREYIRSYKDRNK